MGVGVVLAYRKPWGRIKSFKASATGKKLRGWGWNADAHQVPQNSYGKMKLRGPRGSGRGRKQEKRGTAGSGHLEESGVEFQLWGRGRSGRGRADSVFTKRAGALPCLLRDLGTSQDSRRGDVGERRALLEFDLEADEELREGLSRWRLLKTIYELEERSHGGPGVGGISLDEEERSAALRQNPRRRVSQVHMFAGQSRGGR